MGLGGKLVKGYHIEGALEASVLLASSIYHGRWRFFIMLMSQVQVPV